MVRDLPTTEQEQDMQLMLEIDADHNYALQELSILEIDGHKVLDDELGQIHDDILHHIHSNIDEISIISLALTEMTLINTLRLTRSSLALNASIAMILNPVIGTMLIQTHLRPLNLTMAMSMTQSLKMVRKHLSTQEMNLILIPKMAPRSTSA